MWRDPYVNAYAQMYIYTHRFLQIEGRQMDGQIDNSTVKPFLFFSIISSMVLTIDLKSSSNLS